MGKGKVGGRYGRMRETSGYYGNNTAGQAHKATPKDYGTAREFVGSGDLSFVFYRPDGGVAIVHGESYQDAWRQAKARGYKSRKG